MSRHFKLLGFIANSFPRVVFTTASVAAIAFTDIDIDGKDSCYKLATVGVDFQFTVLCDDAIVDRIMSLPYEDESVFAGRIVTLISQYN